MAASIIDSSIFQGIFTTDAMRHVWSDENRTARYVEVERALAIVQGRLGIATSTRSTWRGCASRPNASATRSWAW
jgi:adenylosuccinate lyase